MKVDSKDDIAKKMLLSLKSTSDGLSLFSKSLQQSGFHSSLPAYRQMVSVLLQQKAWSDSHSRDEMQPIWADIAKNANILYDVLKPYSDIMDAIRMINEKKPIPTKKDHILDYLKKYSAISSSEISETLKIKKKDIDSELAPLVKKGMIEKKGRGKTLSYRLLE